MKPRMVVTGASGALGWRVCQAACQHWQVLGVRRTVRPQHDRAAWNWLTADLTQPEAASQLLRHASPAAVVHCAAEANTRAAQEQPQAAWRINVTATEQLAEACGNLGCRLVFTSTDLVFDGRGAPYAEERPVSPISEYGRQKAEAEQRLRARHSEAVVCRLPLLLAPPAPGGSSALQVLVDALRGARQQRMFVDEFRTPLCAHSAAAGLLLAVDRARGTWHLAGSRVSRYELGLMIARAVSAPQDLIGACRQADVDLPAPRPPDVSLSCQLARREGFAPPPLEQQVRQAVDECVRLRPQE